MGEGGVGTWEHDPPGSLNSESWSFWQSFWGLYSVVFLWDYIDNRPTLDKTNGCFMFQTSDSNFISSVAIQ